MSDAPAFRSRRLPARLGRYLLVERLGSGGMAEVFRAEQDGPAGFKKIVVIKVMHGHLAEDPRFVSMFQREANVAARLNHPNIVSVLELGEVDGVSFIVMEHVDGVSLHKVLRASAEAQVAVPRELIYAAVAEAALGLHAAHTATDHDGTPLEVIHRDISPDNLMISRDGVTKVVDFGIAKSSHLGSDTKSGEIKGKLPYMAPEMLSGATLDRRVDLYALGVTLYVALTGQRPFTGPTEAALMQSILNDTPRRPRDLDPTIAPEVDALVMQLLSKRPADRPNDAMSVHAVLGGAVQRRFDVVVPFLRELRARLATPPTAAQMGQPVTVSSGMVEAVESTVTTKPNASIEATTSWSEGSGKPAAPSAVGAKPLPMTVLSKPVVDPSLLAPTVDDRPLPVPTTDAPSRPSLPAPRSARRIGSAIAAATAAAAVLGLLAFAVVSRPRSDIGTVTPAPVTRPPPPALARTLADAGADLALRGPDAAGGAGAPKPTTTDPPAPRATRTQGDDGAPASRSVRVSAPAHIKWRAKKNGAVIGTGSGELRVPASATTLIAFDPETGGRATVPVADVIDYARIGAGTLDVRAFPYADIAVGKRRLGTTPFPPAALPVGRYTVRATSDRKTQEQEVTVEAGKAARVSFTFE